jgi:hypothetical protein
MGSELLMPVPIINIGASIRELRRRLRLVLGILDALTDKVAEIERELAVMEGARNVSTGEPPPPSDPIAYNLDIRTRANGSVEVTIDGGEKFSLGPRLAEVSGFSLRATRSAAATMSWSAGGQERRLTSSSTTRRASNFAPVTSTIWFIC